MSNYDDNRDFTTTTQGDYDQLNQPGDRMNQGGMRPGEDTANPLTGVNERSTALGGEPRDEPYSSGVGAGAGAPGQTDGYGDNTTAYVQSGGEYDDPGFGKEGGNNKPTMGQKLKGTTDEVIGKMTGNRVKVERGQELKSGDYNAQGGYNQA